jgi:carbon monoxide dehydrogenase subunit G
MEISKTFTVRAPAAEAWAFLTDPGRVVACLPGAALTGQTDDRTYGGTIALKVGPVAATYRGTMRFERLDPVARTAEIVASGRDVRGKGGAEMRMTSRLVERAPGETEIVVSSQVNVMGVLAQFGRGMIEDVSDQLFQRFVEAARAQLESAAAPAGQAAGAVPGPGGAPAAVSPAAPVAAAAGGSPPAGGPQPAAPAPAAAPAPIDVVALGSAAARRAAGRALRRPGVWIAIAAVALLLWWLVT